MTRPPRVLVIGAGFSGLAAAIRLRRAGYPEVTVLEAAGAVGGTWRDNTYPGCACDVPSHLYSFSFELNPAWSRVYPARAEIQAYLEGCVETYGLAPRIRLETAVVAARFDEARAVWVAETRGGEAFEAEVLVAATGPLATPKVPDIPGLAGFAGPVFHTARWDHDAALDGRRVGVVGTGASAVQLVPALADRAAALTVFQRTPSWVVPRNDRAYSDAERARFARYPAWLRAHRAAIYWLLESRAPFFTRFPRVLDWAARDARRHLEAQVADPALRAALTPGYVMGCKRILLSDDYYPALTRPHVELVPGGLAAVTRSGGVDAAGREYPLDALVLATGFDAGAYLAHVEVRGVGGRTLAEAWAGGARSYLGTTVPGFPNLVTMVGPNTGLGHNSVVFMAECQVEHLLACLAETRAAGARSFAPTAAAADRFAAELARRLPGSVWATGCDSWYRDATGDLPVLWPGGTFEFWRRTRRLEAGAYRFG